MSGPPLDSRQVVCPKCGTRTWLPNLWTTFRCEYCQALNKVPAADAVRNHPPDEFVRKKRRKWSS